MGSKNESGVTRLSICIPVHNAMRFLKRCVDSLSATNGLAGIEYVFLDDCSSDGSGRYLRDLLRSHEDFAKRVRLLQHDRNQGAAATRDDLLEAVAGEYFIFCDCDDWVEGEMYERMLKAAEATGADAVVCGIVRHGRGGSVEEFGVEGLSGSRLLEKSIPSIVFNSPCNKMFRTAVIRSAALRYDHNLVTTEDMLFNVRALLACSKIVCLGAALYHYEDAPGSITHRRDSEIGASVVSSAMQAGVLLDDNRYSESRDRLYRDALLSALRYRLLSRAEYGRLRHSITGTVWQDNRYGFLKKLLLSMPVVLYPAISALMALVARARR